MRNTVLLVPLITYDHLPPSVPNEFTCGRFTERLGTNISPPFQYNVYKTRMRFFKSVACVEELLWFTLHNLCYLLESVTKLERIV